MVCLRNFVAQKGGPGTGKMVGLRNLAAAVRWSRRRKDGLPKKLSGSVRWCRHRKDGAPKKLCGSVRWSRHR